MDTQNKYGHSYMLYAMSALTNKYNVAKNTINIIQKKKEKKKKGTL